MEGNCKFFSGTGIKTESGFKVGSADRREQDMTQITKGNQGQVFKEFSG